MANVFKVMSQLKRFFETQEIGYASEGEEVLWGTVYGELTNWQWVIRFCGQSNGIVSLRAGCPVSVITSNATTDYRIKCHHVRYT